MILQKSLLRLLLDRRSNETELATAWIRLGDYFQLNENLLLAERAFEQAEKTLPTSGIPAAKLALLPEQSQEAQRQNVERAIDLEPENPQVNELVGYFWMKNQKPEIALIYLAKANVLRPKNQQVLSALAQVELDLGNLDQSVKYLEENAQVTPGDPTGWVQMAKFCLSHQYQLREHGLEAIRKAILADEKNVQSLDLAGQIYWELGDTLTASDFFQRALAIDATYPPAQLHYGMWLIQAGQKSEARKLIESAIINSDDPALRQQASEVLAGIYP